VYIRSSESVALQGQIYPMPVTLLLCIGIRRYLCAHVALDGALKSHVTVSEVSAFASYVFVDEDILCTCAFAIRPPPVSDNDNNCFLVRLKFNGAAPSPRSEPSATSTSGEVGKLGEDILRKDSNLGRSGCEPYPED
jgi:hypothetical protein